MKNNEKAQYDIEIKDLKRRLEALKSDAQQDPNLPHKNNPFENFDMGEDGDNLKEVIGTFKENFINDDLKGYLNEPVNMSSSPIEISALHSVDIVNNSNLKVNLKSYGESIIEKASQLAKDMAFSFGNDKIPEAFREKQTPAMIEYLKNPIIGFPEDNEHLTEFQARLFEWLDNFGVPAYDNLISLLNELNLSTLTIESRILVAFVAAMAVPKICRVIYKANGLALTSANLLKYDIKYFIYTAVINTPNYRDFMLKRGRVQQIDEINKLLNEGGTKRSQLSSSSSTVESLEDISKKREQSQELKKNSLQVGKLIGLTTIGISVICLSYFVAKLVYNIKLVNHQEKINAQRETDFEKVKY